MFARWLFVRLNAAEKALQQGRIDDAFAAAQQPDIRQHPRGQKLLDDLVKPLVARARLHRQAGRYTDALTDLDRLELIDRAGPDIRTLRQRILEEMRQDAAYDAHQEAAYGRAADQLKAGRLESVRLDLNRVDDTRRREELSEELAARVRRGSQLMEQANEALQRGDVFAAARYWQDACRRHGRTRETDGFAAPLAAAFRENIEQWIREGRIDRLMAAREGLAAVAALEPTVAECQRAVSLCSRAVQQAANAEYTTLRQTLLRLKAACDRADWIDQALKALATVAEGQELLMSSPLGLYASMADQAAQPMVAAGARGLDETVTLPSPTVPTDPDAVHLGRPLLMLVDSGGSSLLVKLERVRIGRGGSSAQVDIPVPGDVQSHHADILLRGDDHFLTAHGPTEVNRRPVTHTLLRDGDRITFGRKAKMVFCKPSSKSATAVLRLSHRSRLPQDVSEVILFRDTCLVGPTPSCHLRTHEGSEQLVLFERGGALCARQTGGPHLETAPAQNLVAGKPLEFGDLRLIVKPYEVRDGGSES